MQTSELVELKKSVHEESWKPAYKFLPDLIQKFNLKVGAEIGVAFGGHSEAILSSTDIELLYGIDSYQHSDSYDDPMNLPQADFDILCETMKNRLAVFGDRFKLIRSDSRQAIGQIDGLLDFVYIDAEHSYQGVWQDLCTWYSKIRVGGLISGHDYGHISFPGVKQAIDEFFRRLDWQVHLEGDGVWWVEKKTTNISFFIPAYNCEQTIEESVDSILNGNFEQGDELIVVDDCSSDNTEYTLGNLKIKYPFIKIVRHKTNKGGGAARNTAVQNATHPLLFCLDSDNILVPGSIQKLKEFLLNSGADTAPFQEIHFFQSQKERVSGKWVFKDRITFADCLSKYDVPGSSGNYIFTKDSWIRAGGYPEFTGALDTRGFGIRQLATGSKMLTLPGAYYLHRQGHESYWIRDSRTRNISVFMGEVLASILHLIDEKEVEYIYGDGKYTWFSELEKRPICVKNMGDNLPYEEILIRQLCFDTKSLDRQEEHPLTNEAWESFRKIVRELILTENPRNFLNWDVINATMFYEPNIIELELKYLQLLPDWLQWKEAIKESPVGNPKPYFAYPESSGNLIHHAYHLAQLMRWTGCALTETTQIVEFGGGYGSMCRLAHQLGFKGQYVIFDIPEFSNLQEYFLKSIGLSTVVVKNQVTEIDRHISLQWDIDKLSQQLSNATSNMAFVATWSISEAPVSVREQVFNLVADAKFYLIAYQEEFEGVNNLEYFAQFAQNKPNYQWYGWAIEHLPGNHYLIGVQTPLEAAKNPVITLSSLGMDNVARLGNNIFQYAFLKIYALENNLKVETPAWIGQYLFGHNDPPISKALPAIGEQAQPYKLSESAILNAREPFKNADFHGYFQFHTQYHAQHKEYFQSLFKPVSEVEAKVIEALDSLRSKGKTVVGLHLRRGDYRSVHTVVPYLAVAPSGWYKEWLDGLWETLDEPVLFIASDEIETVIDNFAEYHPITVKDLGVELPEAPFYPDFYILSQCDVLAISNSTFSFAAAMLNERCKFFFRPHLQKQKLIPFDPWNSEPLLRDHPNKAIVPEFQQQQVKSVKTIDSVLVSSEDPELLWGCSIDSPATGSEHTDKILIGGWVLGKKSLAKTVELLVNDQVISSLPIWKHRPDVKNAFYGIPRSEYTGYSTVLELTENLTASKIHIQAVLEDETRVKMGWLQLQPTEYKLPSTLAVQHKEISKCHISVCAIMKDEAAYLVEWLEFHKIVGVERFYLYNNNSNDSTIDILEEYVSSGQVILHDWPFVPGQILAYEHCLEHHRQESEWIAFIDMDEFLFPTEKDDLKEVLAEFDGVAGVAVNMLYFGSSGHQTKPEGLQIENYTRRSQDDYEPNRYVKTIVQPEKILRPQCPHFFIPVNQEDSIVTENHQLLHGSITEIVSTHKLRINHYYTRSRQEMKEKVMRGDAVFFIKDLEVVESRDRNEVEDLNVQRLIPQVKQAVNSVISQSTIMQLVIKNWCWKSQLNQMQVELEKYKFQSLDRIQRLSEKASFKKHQIKWFFAVNSDSPAFEAYAQMIKVAVYTAIKKTSLQPFCIYDGQENELTDWLRRHHVEIIHHRSRHYDKLNTPGHAPGRSVAAGALLRIDIPKLLENYDMDEEYILYTDCDVMFLDDVCEYLQGFDCNLLAAAPEFSPDDWSYMNSGVLYMNVKNLKKIDREFNEYIDRNFDELIQLAFDQGAYNRFFADKWERLDVTLNWKSYWPTNPAAKILHFHGPKPTQIEDIKSKNVSAIIVNLANDDCWHNIELWQEIYRELQLEDVSTNDLAQSQTKQRQNPEEFEQFTTKLQQVQEELQPIKEQLELRQVQYQKTQEELAQTKSKLIEVQAQLQQMESAVAPLNQLAEFYLAQGKLEDAIALCEQALKIKPNFAPAYKTLGNVFQAQGKLDEAKNYYIRALEIQPDFAQALANLGTIHAQQQQWQQAIASYQQAIAIQPNFAGVYRNLAKVFSQIGKPDEATECWYSAVVLAPETTAEEYLNLGNTLLEQGKQERAIVCYRRAIYLNPSFAEAHDKLREVMSVVGE